MPALQRLRDGHPGEVIPLCQGRSTVGRASGNAVQLSSRMASKHHLLVTCTDGECLVEDISTNGTLLNGRRLTARLPRRLQHGDRIDIGDESFLFLATDSPEDQSVVEAVRPNLAVIGPAEVDPDGSILRCVVRTGDTIRRPVDGVNAHLDERKIVARIPLVELPMRQLTGTDAARRLSQALRAAELACRRPGSAGLAAITALLLETFPSSLSMVIVSELQGGAEWLILWAGSRTGDPSVVLMEPVLLAAMDQCEALLITHQFRLCDSLHPKLSDLDRCSAMCVPLRSEEGRSSGAVLLSGDKVPPFDQDDLERLTVIVQVLSPVFAAQRQEELSLLRADVRRESAGHGS